MDKSTQPTEPANEGPIPFPRQESGHRHWHIPDSRLLGFEIDYMEVLSHRRFKSVQWSVGGPYKVGPRDEGFYESVADFLNQDTAVTEAMMTFDATIEVVIGSECWIICDYPMRNVTRDCIQAISEALLAMPMPTEEEWLEAARQRVTAELSALRVFGIDACALERDPLSPQSGMEAFGWIELAEGPIRWIYCSSLVTVCCAPDSRIRADFPLVSIHSSPVKSFPLFGRVKGVRWQLDEAGNDAKDFSRRVADSLTHDTAPTQEMLPDLPLLYVGTDTVRGCWTIGQHYPMEPMAQPVLTRQLWDCCQAVAEALLVMPTPFEE